MDKETKKVSKVEELKHFPFKNFHEFKKACLEGIIQIGVDRGLAFRWAQGGLYVPKFLSAQTLFLSWLPFLAGIGFIVYAIMSKSWLLLLGLPVLFIGFFFFHPGWARIFGFVWLIVIALIFILFFWALFSGKPGLLAITAVLLVTWYAEKTAYEKAVNSLIIVAAEHEDLLCLLWENKALNIRFYNGNTYWVDWKTEDGKNVHYDNEK